MAPDVPLVHTLLPRIIHVYRYLLIAASEKFYTHNRYLLFLTLAFVDVDKLNVIQDTRFKMVYLILKVKAAILRF